MIMGEIFPLRAKGELAHSSFISIMLCPHNCLIGFMMSIAGSGFWLGSVGVTQLGAVLITSPLNIAGTLLLFAFICFLLFLYILLLVPETKVLRTAVHTVGVNLKFPFCFLSTKPKWYTMLTKNSYKTDKHL